MKKAGFPFVLVVAAFLCQPLKAGASIGGTISNGGGIFLQCGASGTLYTNLTSSSINFELGVSLYGGSPCTAVTLSWTDANARAQSVTATDSSFASVASSLKANGAIAYSTEPTTGGNLQFSWQLERAPAQSVAGQITGAATGPQCGSSGTFFSNLRSSEVSLDFAVMNGSGCSLTLSWTDGSGHSQTLTTSLGDSQGVSTSLLSGGAISWTSTIGNGGDIVVSWQVERVVTSKLW